MFELTLIIAFFVLDGEIEACALNLHSYRVETNCSNSIGCYGCMCNPRCSGRGRDFTGKVILVNQDSREEDLATEKRVIPRRRKDERTAAKCTKMKISRPKRAKLQFFIVKSKNL